MRKVLRILGIASNLVFVSVFTYIMFALVGIGMNDVVFKFGIFFGIICIILGMIELLDQFGTFDMPTEEEIDEGYNALLDQVKNALKPPLYYKIENEDDMYYFEVYAQNHELICVSDAFRTREGAITGLWYLIDAVDRMDGKGWVDAAYENVDPCSN